MDRPLLTHIYPHPTPAPPELYSLLPSPVHVTGSRVSPHVSGITAIEEDLEDEISNERAGSSSPPFYGFSDSDLFPDSASSLKTSPVSSQCTGTGPIGKDNPQTESTLRQTKEEALRSRSITPPLFGFNSNLQSITALASTPVKGMSPSLPLFSPSNQTFRSPAHEHSVDSNHLAEPQFPNPAAMFECTKCENLFVDYQDVLDHVDTFHPIPDTMSAIRRPEAEFLVSMECPVCRDKVVGSREERLMLDHILVKHGERMAKREDIIWNCRICDTQAENDDTILEHIRDRHGSVDRRNDPSPKRVSDGCDVNQPFIKRFKAEVEKRLRNYDTIRSVSDKMNDQTSSENDEDELDEQENEYKEQEAGTDPEGVLTRGQRLSVMKAQLELLLKETKDLKRFLVMEENNNNN